MRRRRASASHVWPDRTAPSSPIPHHFRVLFIYSVALDKEEAAAAAKLLVALFAVDLGLSLVLSASGGVIAEGRRQKVGGEKMATR